MPSDVRTRVVVVLGLAAVGVALAVTGSALGVGDGTFHESDGPAVNIDENVTVVDDDSEVTVVENVSTVETLKVRADDGATIRFETEGRDEGVTASERAKDIARNNETIQRAIEDLESPKFTVEPVVQVDVTESSSFTVSGATNDGDNSTGGGSGTYSVTVNETSAQSQDGMVVVDREPAYASGIASVQIAETGDQVRYAATVDLENETVTGFTDWQTATDGTEGTAVGQKSPSCC